MQPYFDLIVIQELLMMAFFEVDLESKITKRIVVIGTVPAQNQSDKNLGTYPIRAFKKIYIERSSELFMSSQHQVVTKERKHIRAVKGKFLNF